MGRSVVSVLANVLAFVSVCEAVTSLGVDTTVGHVIGMVNGTHPHVAQFLGVPFAEPPVGKLRWEPPVMKSPLAKIDATKFGPSCPQYDTSIPSVYEIDTRQFLISGPTSEDCLTLSIWAPLNHSVNEKLPVVVWLYGGGDLTGGAQIEYQIPAAWVERTQAHIVVEVNYRVNVFGFPKARGLNRTLNLGFLDQRLAMEWVRDNIVNFGGDPSRITLWGQSAGAGAVDYYNFAYPDDPIVQGIIMDSSSIFSYSTTGTGSSTIGDSFTVLASHLGCGNLSASDELACMRNVDSDTIESFLKSYQDAGTSPTISFTAMVDNVTVFSNYTELYLAGNFSKVPAIHGTNNNEGSSLTSWINNGTTYNETAANINTVQRACACQETLYYRHLNNATSFRYYYTGNFSQISPRFWEGAYHSSELPMIFGTHDIVRGPSPPFEYAVSHRMQDLWLAFMRDPYNGLPTLNWPAYTPDGQGLEFAWNNSVDRPISLQLFDDNCGADWVGKANAIPVDHVGLGGPGT